MKVEALAAFPVVDAPPPSGCFWAEDRLAVEMPETPTFLGDRFIYEGARVLITGATGAGKTLFGMGIATAICNGQPFLAYAAGATAVTLYLDYEVGRYEMQRRLKYISVPKQSLAVCCYDDPELGEDGLLPLDSEAGQKQVLSLIDEYGARIVICDNLYSACERSILGGSDKSNGGQAHEIVVPFLRKLSRLRVATVLLHHTGHDKTRAYGDSRLAWQMTAHLHLERPDDAVGLVLKVTAAKMRGAGEPQPFTATWQSGVWSHDAEPPPAHKRTLSAAQKTVYMTLISAIDGEGAPVPAGPDVPSAGARGVSEDIWRRYYFAKRQLVDENSKRERDTRGKLFREARDVIKTSGLAASSAAGWWWLTNGERL